MKKIRPRTSPSCEMVSVLNEGEVWRAVELPNNEKCYGILGLRQCYIAVPPEHKFHGKHHDEIDLEVHGGINFTTASDEFVKRYDGLKLPSTHWVIGWHYNHYVKFPEDYIIGNSLGVIPTAEMMVSEIQRVVAEFESE